MGNHSGLSEQAWCNHKSPYKKETGGLEPEKLPCMTEAERERRDLKI